MRPNCVFTIVAKNYLHFARTLMESVRDDGCDMVVVLCDKLGEYDAKNEKFDVLVAEKLSLPDFDRMSFEYTVLELCTAIKPLIFSYLIKSKGYKKVAYFDPDIYLYTDLGNVFSLLETYSSILVPHICTPYSKEKSCSNEYRFLRAGVFNLGFLALRECSETTKLLSWWSSHTRYNCVVDQHSGLFVDQKFMDLVPALFSGVGIVRDPGWNVAIWNLDQREITQRDDRYYVNGGPIFFFHFSGFRPNEKTVSIHQNRAGFGRLGGAEQQLLVDYKRALLRNSQNLPTDLSYGYGRFEDNSPLPDIVRIAYRKLRPVSTNSMDLFSISFKDALFSSLNDPVELRGGKAAFVSKIMYAIYMSREDLRSSFPDVSGNEGLYFAQWFVTSGRDSYKLPRALVDPIVSRLRKTGYKNKIVHAIFILYSNIPLLRKLFRQNTSHQLRSNIRHWLIRKSSR